MTAATTATTRMPPGCKRSHRSRCGAARAAGALLFALALTLQPPAVQAQAASAPAGRGVEVIVPYAAGGGVSAMARGFAAEAARATGQQWVVLNKEGGGGIVGFAALAQARADGATIVFSPASPLTNSPFINARMPFKGEQIEPVCQVFENVFAIAVRPDSPLQTLADLVARAKANPGAVSYGHAGPASIPHMSVAAVEKAAGVKFNGIPYRGDGPLLTDVLGGTLDFGALGISTLAGKNLRLLAVFADRRHPTLPEVPSITQLGYPAVSPGLNGLYVPAGTPRPVVAQLEATCKAVVGSAAFADFAKTLMQVPQFLDASAFKARIDATYKLNASLVPDLKLEKN